MPLDVALPLSVVSLSIIYSLCIQSPSICVSFLTAVFIRHHNNTGHYSQLQCGRPTLTILIHTVSYTCFPLFPSFLSFYYSFLLICFLPTFPTSFSFSLVTFKFGTLNMFPFRKISTAKTAVLSVFFSVSQSVNLSIVFVTLCSALTHSP